MFVAYTVGLEFDRSGLSTGAARGAVSAGGEIRQLEAGSALKPITST